MWGCEDLDLQMWGCEDLDLQMWGCEDVDLQVWRCEDVGLQMWGCEDVDLQMWGCEDVDQQMWRSEDVDQQVWRCEDVDLQVWRCEGNSKKQRKTRDFARWSAAGGAAPLSFGEERTAVRQCHGHVGPVGPWPDKGRRPLPPTPSVTTPTCETQWHTVPTGNCVYAICSKLNIPGPMLFLIWFWIAFCRWFFFMGPLLVFHWMMIYSRCTENDGAAEKTGWGRLEVNLSVKKGNPFKKQLWMIFW